VSLACGSKVFVISDVGFSPYRAKSQHQKDGSYGSAEGENGILSMTA
jgi:hypothetical protein